MFCVFFHVFFFFFSFHIAQLSLFFHSFSSCPWLLWDVLEFKLAGVSLLSFCFLLFFHPIVFSPLPTTKPDFYQPSFHFFFSYLDQYSFLSSWIVSDGKGLYVELFFFNFSYHLTCLQSLTQQRSSWSGASLGRRLLLRRLLPSGCTTYLLLRTTMVLSQLTFTLTTLLLTFWSRRRVFCFALSYDTTTTLIFPLSKSSFRLQKPVYL